MEKLLEVFNLSKSFGKTKALKNAKINIYKGKVMGLIGENGAGKSTIIKCLSGIHSFESGKIFWENKEVVFRSVKDSEKKGISVVHQELQLVNNITVAENIFLGRFPGKIGLFNSNQIKREANKILDLLNLKFNSSKLVSELTIADQQMVEIAKALSLNSKLIILDEPTDSLSERETKTLFKTINFLKDKGVSFLYVTHRMKEIKTITDHVTIFRDGTFVDEVNTKSSSLDEMIKKMIGRDLKERFPKNKNSSKKVLKYEFKNYYNEFVSDISLKLYKGEILGLVGLVGSGRTEFVKSIIGDIRKSNGNIFVNNKNIKIKNVSSAIKNKIFYVSENRKFDGLDIKASIKDNIIISSLNRSTYKYIKILRWNKINDKVNKMKKKISIKLRSINDPVSSLSGGNQQKVLLAKALLTKPELLILDEPTRGVDIGARKEIYKIMQKAASIGTSIIMISSELPEAIGMSDRIAVFSEGKISGIVENKKYFTEEHLMILATGTGGKNV